MFHTILQIRQPGHRGRASLWALTTRLSPYSSPLYYVCYTERHDVRWLNPDGPDSDCSPFASCVTWASYSTSLCLPFPICKMWITNRTYCAKLLSVKAVRHLEGGLVCVGGRTTYVAAVTTLVTSASSQHWPLRLDPFCKSWGFHKILRRPVLDCKIPLWGPVTGAPVAHPLITPEHLRGH